MSQWFHTKWLSENPAQLFKLFQWLDNAGWFCFSIECFGLFEELNDIMAFDARAQNLGIAFARAPRLVMKQYWQIMIRLYEIR